MTDGVHCSIQLWDKCDDVTLQESPLPQRIREKRTRREDEPAKDNNTAVSERQSPPPEVTTGTESTETPVQDHLQHDDTAEEERNQQVRELQPQTESKKSQRPSKRVRQRMRKRLEKLRLEQDRLISSESGYETTGDHPASANATPNPSPLKPTPAARETKTVSLDIPGDQVEANRPLDTIKDTDSAAKVRPHSRSDSASSANSVGVGDGSLKKLLKDLHRCDVSISRYQTTLDEHCEQGMKMLRRVFGTLRIGLSAREQDLMLELNTTKETAARILKRRKATATTLRQAAEKANTMEEVQVAELRRQIKQFVTDRKVDEEIGTIIRFEADPDDILPLVMGFGRVNNVRHLYSAWEENPEEMIERSKHRDSCFSLPSPASVSPPPGDLDHKGDHEESASQEIVSGIPDTPGPDSAFIETPTEVQAPAQSQEIQLQPQVGNTDPPKLSPSLPISLPSSTIPNSSNPQTRNHKEYQPFTNELSTGKFRSSNKTMSKIGKFAKFYPPLASTQLQKSLGLVFHPPRPRFRPQKPPRFLRLHSARSEVKPPLSETQAESVSKSHRARTAKAPNTNEDSNTTHSITEEVLCLELMAGDRCKHSPEQLATIQARVKESLQQQGVYLYDPFTGAGPPKSPLPEPVADATQRKKKTPTQLRRERKKRQKERERRQSELERKDKEEAEKVANGQNLNQQGDHSEGTTTTGKSSSDSSSDSIQNVTQLETQMAASELKKKKKRKSKPKAPGEVSSALETADAEDSENCPVSTDSENGDESSDVPPTPGTPQVLSPKRPATISEDKQSEQSGSSHPERTESPTNVAEVKPVAPGLHQTAEDTTNASNRPENLDTYEHDAKAVSITKSSVSDPENPAVDTAPELTQTHPEDDSSAPVVSKDSYTEMVCNANTAANVDTAHTVAESSSMQDNATDDDNYTTSENTLLEGTAESYPPSDDHRTVESCLQDSDSQIPNEAVNLTNNDMHGRLEDAGKMETETAQETKPSEIEKSLQLQEQPPLTVTTSNSTEQDEDSPCSTSEPMEQANRAEERSATENDKHEQLQEMDPEQLSEQQQANTAEDLPKESLSIEAVCTDSDHTKQQNEEANSNNQEKPETSNHLQNREANVQIQTETENHLQEEESKEIETQTQPTPESTKQTEQANKLQTSIPEAQNTVQDETKEDISNPQNNNVAEGTDSSLGIPTDAHPSSENCESEKREPELGTPEMTAHEE